MIFEIGKYYEHTTGCRLFIAGCVASHFHGMCFVGEDEFGNFIPTGCNEDNALNYREVTKEQFLSPTNWKSYREHNATASVTDIDKAETLRKLKCVDAIEKDSEVAEMLADYYIKKSGKNFHTSNCATSCSPAYCPRPCDC